MAQDAATYRPWGLGATIGFGLIIGAGFVLIQVLVGATFVVVKGAADPSLDLDALATSLETNGFLLALATCATMLGTIGLVALFVRLRKHASFKQYLQLNPVPAKTLIGWLGIVVLFGVLWDGLTHLLGRPIIPDFLLAAYQTAYFPPLLWLALIAAAPLAEEVFFRGFLFEGIRYSRLGAVGAVVLTSLLWSVIHLQYGAYEITTVFALGVVLGIARLRTGSLYTTVAMHAFANFLATIEVVFYLHYLNGG